MISKEEAQILQAMKLIAQYEGRVAGFKIRRLLQQQVGLSQPEAEKVMIEAATRLLQKKYEEDVS